MEHRGQMNLAVEFENGRQTDLEVGETDQLWVTLGQGFTGADVWVKAGGDMIDMRVRVRRTEKGIEVMVDRGDDRRPWWNAEAVPRLAIAVSAAAGIATATASIGNGQEFQEVLLGRTSV